MTAARMKHLLEMSMQTPGVGRRITPKYRHVNYPVTKSNLAELFCISKRRMSPDSLRIPSSMFYYVGYHLQHFLPTLKCELMTPQAESIS
jgi:hypothetical protein